MAFGNTTVGISSPLGGIAIGERQASGYTLFLVGLAAVEMLALWCLLRFTDFGLRARACMQNAAMASARA